ncbi:uncharacterized protein K460DRAFT_365729 [Cucurbitaria berberidis CBS 394.84]|uniref:SWIM-type domain-containing protein n=1 Tax=Cucurbitaria berberidis CBS 394.84 TaxID=1168544 RepID=A0A9P4GG16_9PLEO|nr:uncharacterized protein K460DRAFT_365729 [Cucurbitaria berberidis CBS 394.84]KAF1844769.1 hypothetical protein K460DRAFT_365729 [Cucurbitaria berberidis CBS 394.84]
MQQNPAMPAAALPSSRAFVTQLLNSLSALSQHTADAAEESTLLSAVPDETKKQLLSLQVLFPSEFIPALDLLDRRLVTRFHIGSDTQQSTIDVGLEAELNHHGDIQYQQENRVQTGDEPMKDADHEAITTPAFKASIRNPTDKQTEDQTIVDVPTQGDNTPTDQQSKVYYVRSAQQRSSRYSTSYDTTSSYEVRLQAWNCSCPAFAFSAFPAVHPEPPATLYSPANVADATVEQQTTGQEEHVGWTFGGVGLGDGMPPVCKHLLACVLAERCSGLFGAFIEERHVSVEEAAGRAAGWGD